MRDSVPAQRPPSLKEPKRRGSVWSDAPDAAAAGAAAAGAAAAGAAAAPVPLTLVLLPRPCLAVGQLEIE